MTVVSAIPIFFLLSQAFAQTFDTGEKRKTKHKIDPKRLNICQVLMIYAFPLKLIESES